MSSEPAQTKSGGSTKAQTFVRRLSSTLVLWGIVLGAIFSKNEVMADYFFLTIMSVLAAIGLTEFYDMAEKRGYKVYRPIGILGGLLLVCSTFFYLAFELGVNVGEAPSKAADFESAIMVIVVLGLALLQIRDHSEEGSFLATAVTILGLMYVVWLLNFIQKINYFPNIDGSGRFFVLYFILVTKFSDVGAYVTGSLIGKHKMIPSVSPGKTWEGFVGAIVISTGLSLLAVRFLGDKLPGMDMRHAFILGIVLSVSAVVGDLVESALKRGSGVKDSGRYLPGIGGVLDLLDSLLFNAPLMYLYMRHVLSHG